jgi:hypothetical protein
MARFPEFSVQHTYGEVAMRYPTDMSDVRHLTIRTFETGDPRGYFLVGGGEMVRMGEPLACFRSRVGGDEGFVIWRDGDTYWVSLRPWDDMDPELTYVHPVFHRPYDRAALEQKIAKPRRAHPRSRAYSPYARMGWVSVFAIDCSAYGFDHEISLYPPTPMTETSAEELLTYPEMHERTVRCPLCDTIIPLEEPLAPRIREMAIELGNPEARMQLVVTHPTDLPQTERGDETYHFVVDRYERYFPIEPR